MSDWLKKAIQENAENYRKTLQEILNEKKEATTMQVSYKGFTGELVRLDRKNTIQIYAIPAVEANHVYDLSIYDLSIYDSEKQVTHSFTDVTLADVRFLGGAVSFGG